MGFIFSIHGYSQNVSNRCGEIFTSEKYPADSFSTRELTHDLGNTQIIFTLVHHDYLGVNNGFYQIWVEQRKDDEVIRGEYWGFEEGENGYQFPNNQLFKNYFIVNRSREFTGVFYLINSEGIWFKIPGGELYTNEGKSILFTHVPVECGGCQIGLFDLKSRQLTTKLWDGNGVAWDEIGDTSGAKNIFETGEWIKWQ